MIFTIYPVDHFPKICYIQQSQISCGNSITRNKLQNYCPLCIIPKPKTQKAVIFWTQIKQDCSMSYSSSLKSSYSYTYQRLHLLRILSPSNIFNYIQANSEYIFSISIPPNPYYKTRYSNVFKIQYYIFEITYKSIELIFFYLD